MTEKMWRSLLTLLDENEERIKNLPVAQPIPKAQLCRESAHLTLGHLTSCQAAWLPLMRFIRDGQTKGRVAIRPNPLYTKLGFKTAEWIAMRDRFIAERAEWRSLLAEVDLNAELQTETRIWNAKTLTRRLVEHEKGHLDGLGPGKPA